MLIYFKSNRVLPYVYMSVERTTNNFYIGYRFANKVPSSDDLGKFYFTSNDYVKKNFNNFNHIILAEFFDRKSAYEFEALMIQETKCDRQINQHRIKKFKGKPYSKNINIEIKTKICPLPECGKLHQNWRMKCCCLSHSRIYAAMSRHMTK